MWRSIRSGLKASGFAVLLTLFAGLAGAGGPLVLAVRLNGLDRDELITVHFLADGSLAVAERDLRAWRLNLPVGAAMLLDGQPHVRLADLPGLEYRIEPDSQTLLLRAPATAFEASALAWGGDADTGLTPSQPGGFFNYDLSWQRQDGSARASGLFEAGLFNAWGSGTSTALWNGPAERWLRLDTTWTVDMPERMQTLRLGDAVGAAGAWGRPVRFGGVQWATNFATRPGFIAFPLPTLRGEAALPSTLDVYLDNARIMRGEVPAGPFDLSNMPVITGQGELRMVVHDLLGRQQVISQPYYASPRLLRPGLRDFAWELGAVREDYGLASNRYGRGLLAVTERYGLDPAFTAGWRAEILADQQTLGGEGVWLLPAVAGFMPGTLEFGAAFSHGPAGYGRLLMLGAEHQSSGLSFGFQVRHAERDFVQLGQSADATPRLTLTASLGLSLAGQGLNLGFARQTTWQGDDRRLLSAGYSLPLGRAGQFGLYALKEMGGDGGFSVTALWSLALDADTGLSASLGRQDGETRPTLQVQRNAPAGPGIGYRLFIDGDRRYQAGATLQTDRAVFTAEAARLNGRTGVRAGVSGGVAVAGGGVFPSLRLDGSFAVVKVGDFANVRVYRDNQEVARTDSRGLAMITRLRAYEKNPVAVEQADLPIDAEVDTLELKLTPALRSGVVAEFPVRRGHQARLRLIDDAGQPLPAGVRVRIDAGAREFPVGFDGRLFLSDLGPNTRLQAEWGGRRCQAELVLDNAAGPMPDLGTLICKGVTP